VSGDPRIECSYDTVGWRGDLAKVTSCGITKIQILEFPQTRSKFKMNFKFHFKMFVCELISTNKVLRALLPPSPDKHGKLTGFL
jgi:hypothetical protein